MTNNILQQELPEAPDPALNANPSTKDDDHPTQQPGKCVCNDESADNRSTWEATQQEPGRLGVLEITLLSLSWVVTTILILKFIVYDKFCRRNDLGEPILDQSDENESLKL